jgi:hypothetical protein
MTTGSNATTNNKHTTPAGASGMADQERHDDKEGRDNYYTLAHTKKNENRITINKDNIHASEIPRSTLGMTKAMDMITFSRKRKR